MRKTILKLRLLGLKRLLARHRAAGYYPAKPRLRWLFRLIERHGHAAALGFRFVLTVIVVGHLALAALLPGGSNGLLGLQATSGLEYLSLFPAEGTMGFYKTNGKDGFVVYRIFTEQGTVVEGAFPDMQVTPRLRYDRWAMLGHHLSTDNPRFHYVFMNYLVERLPGAPLKLEMLSAKWAWRNYDGAPALDGGENGGKLVLRKLGSYDGVRKNWEPARGKERR